MDDRRTVTAVAEPHELHLLTNDFEDFVGRDFSEAFSMVGLETRKLTLPVSGVSWLSRVFSVTATRLEGLAYSLWKSVASEAFDWMPGWR